MAPGRLSLKARLALLCGLLFLLSGVALLSVNYFLIRAALPPTGTGVPTVDSRPPPTGAALPPPSSVAIPVLPGDPARRGAQSGVVSANLAEYRQGVLNTMFVQSLATLVVTVILALFLGWVAANRVLRPVRAITTTARRLSADNLDQRIGMRGARDELTELADTFDQMLDRLAASFESQRRFVANASHELRTPIAAQRTLIEVALADPAEAPATQQLCRQLLPMNNRIESVIEGLLTLARSDRGLAEKEELRLDHLAAAVLDDHQEAAERAGVSLEADLSQATIACDRVLMERLIANLVDNAIKYNHPGGTVWLEVGRRRMRVANTGPTVPAESIPQLCTPFRQLRSTPSGANRGVGLGLSIVASIARAHGGSIQLSPRAGGGLDAAIMLP